MTAVLRRDLILPHDAGEAGPGMTFHRPLDVQRIAEAGVPVAERLRSGTRPLRRVPWSEGLGGDEHILDDTFRRRRGKAILAQAIEMKLDCSKQLGFGFLDGGASRDATRQSRRIPGEIVSGFFDNDGIAHGFNL